MGDDPAGVDVWFSAGADLGEGPYWDADQQMLGWVDIRRGEIHTLNDQREHSVVVLEESVGSAVPLSDRSGWIAGVRSGVAIVNSDGSIRQHVEIDADREHHRMNDGACDTRGRFWTGTKNDQTGPPSDSLYRVDADLSVTEVVTGVGLANGIAWSPDDLWMYFVDSAAGTITRYPFDVESGSVGAGAVLVEFDSQTGEPDGITVDAEGNLWVAIWDGSRVDEFDAEGRPLRTVAIPTPRPTSCTLAQVGPDAFLYVTTAAPDRSAANGDRAAGSILRTKVDARPLPLATFRGPVIT